MSYKTCKAEEHLFLTTTNALGNFAYTMDFSTFDFTKSYPLPNYNNFFTVANSYSSDNKYVTTIHGVNIPQQDGTYDGFIKIGRNCVINATTNDLTTIVIRNFKFLIDSSVTNAFTSGNNSVINLVFVNCSFAIDTKLTSNMSLFSGFASVSFINCGFIHFPPQIENTYSIKIIDNIKSLSPYIMYNNFLGCYLSNNFIFVNSTININTNFIYNYIFSLTNTQCSNPFFVLGGGLTNISNNIFILNNNNIIVKDSNVSGNRREIFFINNIIYNSINSNYFVFNISNNLLKTILYLASNFIACYNQTYFTNMFNSMYDSRVIINLDNNPFTFYLDMNEMINGSRTNYNNEDAMNGFFSSIIQKIKDYDKYTYIPDNLGQFSYNQPAGICPEINIGPDGFVDINYPPKYEVRKGVSYGFGNYIGEMNIPDPNYVINGEIYDCESRIKIGNFDVKKYSENIIIKEGKLK